MEPAVGDEIKRYQLIHGHLYYLKFDNADDYSLVFYDKRLSYRSPEPFIFVGIDETSAFNEDSFTIYNIEPQDYMTDELMKFKRDNVSHIPANMGDAPVRSPDNGKIYYFYGSYELEPVKGKLLDVKEVYIHRRSNDTEEVYVVQTDYDIEHFPLHSTDVYAVVTRNNVLKKNTLRKMVRNKGLNRTLRNVTNIATNTNNVYGRRKALLNFRKKAWNN
jgi:hypothetical protein